MTNLRLLLLPVLAAACARSTGGPPITRSPGPSAVERPRPYPVFETAAFRRAVEAGARTRSGRPGPNYWQQYASYRLEATIDPARWQLTGRGTVRYQNNSPDTLRNIWLHLYQNLFAPDAMRNDVVPVTGGMRLTAVTAAGQALVPAAERPQGAHYQVSGTALRVRPAAPVAPGQAVELGFEWSYAINEDGGPRGGHDDAVAFIAYWYPQVAVYDDSRRWHTDPYMANSEFYMGYADYDVALTVPAGWLIGGTGALVNAAEALSPRTLARLAEARRGGRVVSVVGESERGATGGATAPGPQVTWRFRAANVRDFAFSVSDRYLWDATIALVGDHTGDGRPDTADIHTFYRPERRAWAWDRSAEFARHSIEFLSRWLWPYPYPHATASDGVASCGGMEYPMITCIGGRRDTLSLYSVTVHELAHFWFPMQVGSDEKRYAWQDEGLTRFNQAEAMREFFRGFDLWANGQRAGYLNWARTGDEVELMRHGDLYPVGTPAYGIASYNKMGLNLRSLRAIVGDSLFATALREYGRRWLGRHPTPFDFFNTFNDVSGRDLSWFWRTWWYETWTLDQAIAGARLEGGELVVEIDDRGLAPMPVLLAVTREGGALERVEVPVEVWLAGAVRTTVRLRDGARVSRVEIDPELAFPDIDRTNQVWNRGN